MQARQDNDIASGSRTWLEQFLDQSADAIAAVDLKGSVQYVNDSFAEWAGLPAEAVTGSTVADLGVDGFLDFWNRVKDDVAGGETRSDTLHLRKNSTGIEKRPAIARPIYECGSVIGAAITLRDIAGHAKQEIQILHSQKMVAIGELASGIAHEINTPTQYIGDNLRFLQGSFDDINNVLVKCEKLLKKAAKTPGLESAAQEIEGLIQEVDLEYLREDIPQAIIQSLDGNARVADIVKAMKEFAHPDQDDFTPTNLNHAIETAIAVSRNEWRYHAEMETDFDPALPPVMCIPGAFNQVVLNLVVNAAHAIESALPQREEEKGTIHIATRCIDGDTAEVRIRDTGIGVPEEIRGRIFDPFFTTKEVGKGTGQGLASAHFIIADKHRGSLTFETERGKGTTFIVRLPLVHEDS